MTFSNLCALYENACLDYEVSVLTEGADSEEAKTAKDKATAFGKKVWNAIKTLFLRMIDKINYLIKYIGNHIGESKIVIKKDILAVDISAYKKLLNHINESKSTDELNYYIDNIENLLSPSVLYKKGVTVNVSQYKDMLLKFRDFSKKIYNKLNSIETVTKKDIQTNDYYNLLILGLDAGINSIKKDINNFIQNKLMPTVESCVTNNISDCFMTRNELRAKLLIEAADLLNEGAATEVRKEIIKDIKIQKQEDLYKKFKNTEMDYNETKKYYATIKKEIATLRNKLAQIPAETAFEKLKISVGKDAVGATIGGAITYAMGSFIGGFWGSLIKKIGLSTTGIVILALTGVGIASDSILSKIEGEAFNWNKDKALEKLDKFEEKVDNVMEYYEETHNDEISSKNESIDLFI